MLVQQATVHLLRALLPVLDLRPFAVQVLTELLPDSFRHRSVKVHTRERHSLQGQQQAGRGMHQLNGPQVLRLVHHLDFGLLPDQVFHLGRLRDEAQPEQLDALPAADALLDRQHLFEQVPPLLW